MTDENKRLSGWLAFALIVVVFCFWQGYYQALYRGIRSYFYYTPPAVTVESGSLPNSSPQ